MNTIKIYLQKLSQTKHSNNVFTVSSLLVWLRPLYSFIFILIILTHTACSTTPENKKTTVFYETHDYKETIALKLHVEFRDSALSLSKKNNAILSRGRDAANQRGVNTISLHTELELFSTLSDWTQLWEKHSAYFINQKLTSRAEAINLTMPKFSIALSEASVITRFLSLRYNIPEFNEITESLLLLQLMLSQKGIQALANESDLEALSGVLHLSFLPDTFLHDLPMQSFGSMLSMSSTIVEKGGKDLSILANVDIESVQQQEVEKLFHPFLEEHLLLRLRLGYMIDDNLKITSHDILRVQYALNHTVDACMYMAFLLHDRSWISYSIELLELEHQFLKITRNEKLRAEQNNSIYFHKRPSSSESG